MIDVKVNHTKTATDKKYPYIGIWDEIVVLFTKEGYGVSLGYSGIGRGAFCSWQEKYYTPLNGSITLTQN